MADQITGRNDDYLLGIPKANFELTHMSMISSYNTMLLMWSQFISIRCNDKLNDIGLATFTKKQIYRFLYFHNITTCLFTPY